MHTALKNKYLSDKLRLNIASLLLIVCIFTLAVSPTMLYAQGTSAGVDIGNKAIVTYSIDGEQQNPIESSPNGNRISGIGGGQQTIFKVDRKIDLSITSNGNTHVSLGETQAELNFVLSNDGNDIQEFLLSPDGTLAGDNFDSSNCKVEITAVTGTPLTGVVLPSYDNIMLSPDQQASISVKCDIPFDNNGQAILTNHESLLSIHAHANKNSDGTTTVEENTPDSANTLDTVFVDSAGTDDAQRDASHSTRAAYIALAPSTETPPTLSINKTIVTVVDPQGGNKAVTGSIVTYKIRVSTAGEGIINDVIITDPTPAEMTYKSGSIKLNNITLTDSIDTDQGEFSTQNNIITINLGNITAGSQQEILLTYVIN